MAKDGKWMQDAVTRPGALRAKAKRARLAETFAKFRKH